MSLFTRTRIIIFGLLLSMTLAACGTTQSENIELAQSISGEMFGGTVEISYPAEWTAAVEEDKIEIANQETFITEGISSRRTGDIVGGAMPLPKEALFTFDLDSDAPVSEVARVLAEKFGADIPNLIVSSPVVFNFNGHRGAVAAGTARGSGASAGRVALAVIDLGDVIGVVTLSVYGEGIAPADYARAIVESFSFTAG